MNVVQLGALVVAVALVLALHVRVARSWVTLVLAYGVSFGASGIAELFRGGAAVGALEFEDVSLFSRLFVLFALFLVISPASASGHARARRAFEVFLSWLGAVACAAFVSEPIRTVVLVMIPVTLGLAMLFFTTVDESK